MGLVRNNFSRVSKRIVEIHLLVAYFTATGVKKHLLQCFEQASFLAGFQYRALALIRWETVGLHHQLSSRSEQFSPINLWRPQTTDHINKDYARESQKCSKQFEWRGERTLGKNIPIRFWNSRMYLGTTTECSVLLLKMHRSQILTGV